jgi:hypothetical protein
LKIITFKKDRKKRDQFLQTNFTGKKLRKNKTEINHFFSAMKKTEGDQKKEKNNDWLFFYEGRRCVARNGGNKNCGAEEKLFVVVGC